MYDFDKKIDRTLSKCRKWDMKLMKEKFGIWKNTIPMDIADMDFECAPKIKEALVRRASLGDYGYSYATDEYYEAVINWKRRRHNISIKREWVKLMFGTCGALRYLCQCFCKPGDSIIINTPVYDPFDEAINDAHCMPVYNSLVCRDGRYYIDFDTFEQQIIANNVQLYILCNPHNPGGTVWTKDELYKLSEICLKHKVIIVSDEVHGEMIFSPAKFTTLYNSHPQIANHSITCTSLNKAFNIGGLKSSYMYIKNPELRQKALDYISRLYVTSPHVFVVPATLAAYNESEQWLDELVDYIQQNFEYAYTWFSEHMPKARVMKAESSYLLWVDLNDVFNNEEEMKRFFKNANITIVEGSYFVCDGEGWARLNLGTHHDVVVEAFNRLQKQLNHLD